MQLQQFERVHSRWAIEGLKLIAMNVSYTSEGAAQYTGDGGLSFPMVLASEDIAGVYNLTLPIYVRQAWGSPNSQFLSDR